MNEQFCPICSSPVEPNVRYRNYICFECCSKAVDDDGRKLGFGNESFSGGFVAWYADTNETRDSHLCYIDGIECWADEAHMGGIVIRIYDEEMKRWCPKVSGVSSMKLLILLLAVSLAFAGCAGDSTSTNSAANTAASNSNASSVSTTGYPQSTVDAFLSSCQQAGSDLTFCSCVLGKVQGKYTFEEFSVIESQLVAGDPPDEFVEFTGKARAECTKK